MVAITVATNVTVRTGAQGIPGIPGTAAPHAADHEAGGDDEVTVEDLITAGTAGQVPTSDGAGALTMETPAGNVSSPGSETSGNLAEFTGDSAIAETSITTSSVSGHLSSTSNPHSVTAAQAGAEPSGSIATHAADADAHHDESHTLASHSDVATTGPALDAHIASTSNPHSVTAAQASAEPAGAIATHAALPDAHHDEAHTLASHSDTTTTGPNLDAHIADVTGNPHAVTAALAGAEPAGSIATHAALSDVHHAEAHTLESHTGVATTGAQLDAHLASTANPHSVTAAQAGADPTGTATAAVSAHDSNATAHSNLPVEALATAGTSGQVPVSDGAGNLVMTTPAGSGNVISPGGETAGRVTKFTGSGTIDETATTETELATAVTNTHSESHTVASHSDTSSTGAELDTAVTHSGIVTGNPHALDATDVSAEPAGAVSTHDANATAHSNLPVEALATAGTNGQVPTSDGAGNLVMTTPAGGGGGDFFADGSVPMTDDLDVGGNDVVNFIDTAGSGVTGSLKDFISRALSAGRTDGGEITVASGTEVDVAAGTGSLRATADPLADLVSSGWSASLAVTIPLDDVLFIGVEWNSGTPQIVTKAGDSWDYLTEFPLGSAVRDSTGIHITFNPQQGGDAPGATARRFYETLVGTRDSRSGGILLGEIGTRNMTLSAGALWLRLNRVVISAIDTSVSGSVDFYYRDNPSGFNVDTGLTQWPNTQYDDGSGTLVTLAAGKYAVLWFYVGADGDLVAQYGRDTHSKLKDAREESLPDSAPVRISEHAFVIGRYIFQNAAATTEQVDSVFDILFKAVGVTDHSELSGILPDDHHAELHAADHSAGGADEVNIEDLASTGNDGQIVMADGEGALELSNALIQNSKTGVVDVMTGLLSINAGDAATIDIRASQGVVVNFDPDPTAPTRVPLVWAVPFEAVPLPGLAANLVSSIYVVDGGGGTPVVEVTNIFPTPEDRRTKLLIGFAFHAGATVVDAVDSAGVAAWDTGSCLDDTLSALGDFNLFGNVYVANIGGNLLLDKGIGQSFGRGLNPANINNQHTLDNPLDAGITFYNYTYRDGASSFTESIEAEIDPANYDDGTGTLASVGNKYTIQRIIFTPRGGGRTAIEYGQKLYNSLADAIDGITENGITKNPDFRSAILRGWVVSQGTTTDLTDAADAVIRERINEVAQPSGSGTDINAIHVNGANEISGITPKVTLVPGDLLLIENSESGNVKGSVEVGVLDARYAELSGATFTGEAAGPTPTAGASYTNKDYVDSLVQGIDWQESVISDTVTTPPVGAPLGDRYLIPVGATGVWFLNVGNLAEGEGGSWAFTVRSEGMTVAVKDIIRTRRYNGSVWVTLGSTIDHGNLAGLDDDDHAAIYFNKTLSDARFAQLTGAAFTGAITTTSTIDGRDVDADGTAQDTHIADTSNPHGTAMQDAYNAVSGTPSVLTSDAVGAAYFKRGTSGGDGDVVFGVMNGSGGTTVFVTGSGLVGSVAVTAVAIEATSNLTAAGILTSAEFRDAADLTKAFKFDTSGITTATTRTITVPDADITLGGTSLVGKFYSAHEMQAFGSTDHVNNSLMGLTQDTDNDAIRKMNGNAFGTRTFSLQLPIIPTGATRMQITLSARPDTGPSGVLNTDISAYERDETTVIGAWSSSIALDNIAFPDGETDYINVTTDKTLAAWGLTVGNYHRLDVSNVGGNRTIWFKFADITFT